MTTYLHTVSFTFPSTRSGCTQPHSKEGIITAHGTILSAVYGRENINSWTFQVDQSPALPSRSVPPLVRIRLRSTLFSPLLASIISEQVILLTPILGIQPPPPPPNLHPTPLVALLSDQAPPLSCACLQSVGSS